MVRKSFIFICLLASLCTWAQGPNNSGTYYKNADGKSGESLKTALCGIISKKSKSPSYDDFLELYKITDTRPDGKVRDWYSNATNFVHIKDKAGNYKQEGDVYNREHLVPQSWGPAKAGDITYVVPTDGYVNNRRSSYPFGEVGTATYTSANGYSKLGSCKTPGYTGVVFEPNDEVKGDIARIYFYMTTCYENTCTNWSGVFTGGTKYQPLAQWTYDMMVRWSQLDPIDDVERARNNAIARTDVQGNRNPFVDYPGLEQYIWGSKKDVAFSYDNYESGSGEIAGRVEQPVFSPEEGTFADSVVVTISCATEGATIYYTTNGVDASTNSSMYTEPLHIKATTTLKAIAVKADMATSYQQTATYTITTTEPYTPGTGTDEVVFALNNATFGTVANGSLSGSDLHDYTATKDGITVTYAKGSATNMYMNGSQIRLYAGNSITVTSTGNDITDMEFTLVLNKSNKVMQCSTGTISDLTWTGKAQSVTFSVNSGSGHLQLSQLKVKLAADEQHTQPVEGDVNGDNAVDVADIASIISIMATGSAGDSPASADVNGDGTVDVADIATVISIMAGTATSTLPAANDEGHDR